MSHIAIRVENLSKKYVISHQRERGHKTLCDVIAESLTAPWRSLASRFKHVGTANNGNGNTPCLAGSRLNSELRPPTLTSALAPREDFWALKDVCFEIKQGEVVGVIGRNGAGKSTLLKILSRITEPTKGRIEIDGRVASLLEVGTGFHPELTGRENIYLNGAILGMSRLEIKRKFDEIVDFAEIGKFLDTPIKRYSSGMYVRLAFAVAAHLEPEILIVDEVLAVGDQQFQNKCIGKMREVAQSGGRTVLFVSHNMLAVQKLCTSGLLFEKGCIRDSGYINDIITNYVSTGATDVYSNTELTGQPQIVAARILTQLPRTDIGLEMMVEWTLPEDMQGIKIGIGFSTPEGQRIFDCAPEDMGLRSPHIKGRYTAIFKVPPNTLMARHYHVGFGLWKNSTVFDFQNPALAVAVEPAPNGPYSHENVREGLININCNWIV